MTDKKYVTYKQYNKQVDRIESLKNKGVEFIHTKSKIKIWLGGMCLVVAIIPNGLGLIFYPLGFSLLTSGGVDIYALFNNKKDKIRGLWARLTGGKNA